LVNYYGSDLNKFIDENCFREMSCINIDCLLLKRSEKKIRIIESKHSKEKLPESQAEALTKLYELLKSSDHPWDAMVYLVRGDPPYEYVEITEWTPEQKTYTLTQKELIEWLEFKKELKDFNPLSRFFG